VNKSARIKATAAGKRARLNEAGLRGPRVGKVSAATRRAQARRDATPDAVVAPVATAKGKSPAGTTASTEVATRRLAADAKARTRRASPVIEVRTANSVQGSARLDTLAEEAVRGALSRFMPRVTRIDVHLSDANADKGGDDDKRCQIEVRPASRRPVSATATAGTVEKALATAVGKMERLLAGRFGRARTRASSTTSSRAWPGR
jgi:hypothetical protein